MSEILVGNAVEVLKEIHEAIDGEKAKGTYIASESTFYHVLREEKMRQLEDLLQKAVNLSQEHGISLEELTQILTLIYQEER